MNHNFKIMVVEDEAITAMMICSELDLKGYMVCEPVSSGEEAILRAESEKPDLILMDVGLGGGIDGITAAEDILSKIHPHLIFMTGYSSDACEERGKKLNPVTFITKPLQMNELYRVIENLMHDTQ
jgi:CheY-like chemotaxis protein